MKIYIARHGETNYNDQALCNSDPTVDVHLTPEGKVQARTLASKLKDISIDHIFVSELRRTQQTAEIVNQHHHMPVEVSPLLNDHLSGFEGKPASLLIEALDSAADMWTARFNGGESIEDMKSRVAEFLEQLKTRPFDSVLIVTSGWIVRAVAALLHGLTNEEAWEVNAAQGDYLEFEMRL